MKKNRSILSIIVSMMMLVSISTSAFSQSGNEDLLYDSEEKIIGTMEASPSLLARRSLSHSTTSMDKMYSSIKSTLNAYGINFSDVNMNIRKISSPKNDDIYYKIIFG